MTASDRTMGPGKAPASAAFPFRARNGDGDLFADTTYEGGASITGPFLQSLGASALAVSIIAGVGEFFGYSLPFGAGYMADKTERYWLITFFGYAITMPTVIATVCLSSLFSPFVFLGGVYVVLFGLILWASAMRRRTRFLKALIAGMLPQGRRNLAFGLYYTGYGAGWLMGSIVAGLLYERSRPWLIAFSILVQLASVPFFLLARQTHT